MERVFNKSARVILLIILVLTIIGIANISFAETIYTSNLKEKDILSFSKNGATAWSVYNSKGKAAAPDKNTASKWLKTGDKIRIDDIDDTNKNVLKISLIRNDKLTKNYGYIYYGPDASTYFEKSEVAIKSIKCKDSLSIKKGKTVTLSVSVSPASTTEKYTMKATDIKDVNGKSITNKDLNEMIGTEETKSGVKITGKQPGSFTLQFYSPSNLTKPLKECKITIVDTTPIKFENTDKVITVNYGEEKEIDLGKYLKDDSKREIKWTKLYP